MIHLVHVLEWFQNVRSYSAWQDLQINKELRTQVFLMLWIIFYRGVVYGHRVNLNVEKTHNRLAVVWRGPRGK